MKTYASFSEFVSDLMGTLYTLVQTPALQILYCNLCVRLSASKILASFLMLMMLLWPWTHAMTILLLDKESGVPSLLVCP